MSEKLGCYYCIGAGEREPGWVQMDNNGPCRPCPICNPKTDRELEYERALAQRARDTSLGMRAEDVG